MLPKGFSDEVRQQADIVRVISDYVALKKRGANWIACCPFHSEKTPSFNVHAGKGIYKCFGCGVGGSVFDFVMTIEGCSFPEAVKVVAGRSGIPIPESTEAPAEAKREERRRKRVLELNEWACEFFESQLGFGEEGKRALEYVESRGIETGARERLRLGYSPNSWDTLSLHLVSRGATREEVSGSGLVTVREGEQSGRYYDRFRGRVMFPISDSQGRIVAFGGRAMGDDQPKYLNSPETPVYTKGQHLYGISLSKDAIRRAGFAVLVEGYLDFAIPFQAGIENVVASLGTALTEAQTRLLRRYLPRPQVIVNYDADAAGQEATRRSFETLLAQGFKINVLELPDGKDPDEFVRTHGADAYRALLKTTTPYIDYIVEQAVARHDVSRPAGKAEALNDILPYVAQIADRIERVEYADRIARRLGIEDDLFRKELRRAANLRETKVRSDRVAPPRKMSMLERRFLVVLFADAGVRSSVLPSLEDEDIEALASEEIFRAVRAAHVAGEPIGYAELSERLSDGARNLLTSLLETEADDIVAERKESWADALGKEAHACLAQLRRARYERERNALQQELTRAETQGDSNRCDELSLRKMELGRLLEALNQTA